VIQPVQCNSSNSNKAFEGYLPTASLLKWDISCSCAPVDKISTDMVRRAVPLQ